MGHAHHFLSRLDRVPDHHVQLALELYRDERVVRHVLSSARLPADADRVAVSLEHPTEGPFVVMTREGRFVTCLAPGMKPGGLPIITREQLEARREGLQRQRARENLLAGFRTRFDDVELFRRLWSTGPDLTREEWEALAAFSPLLARDYLGVWFEIHERVRTGLPGAMRIERAVGPARRVLHDYYADVWALAHIMPLVVIDESAMNHLSRFDKAEEFLVEAPRLALMFSVTGLTLRTLWWVSRTGAFSLRGFKRAYHEAVDFYDVMGRGLALAAIGLGHARMSAEVRKTLAGATGASPEVRKLLLDCYDRVLQSPEQEAAFAIDAGRTYASTRNDAGEGPLPLRSPERIPEDLAYSFLAAREGHCVPGEVRLRTVFAALPYLMRAPASTLLLPRDVQRQVRVPWKPQHTWQLLYVFERHAPREPVHAAPAPGRNDPCSCGSGKKYKKCCEGKPSGASDHAQ